MSATIAAEPNLLESLLGAIGSAVKHGREYSQSVGLTQKNQDEPFWLGMTNYNVEELNEILRHSTGTIVKWPLYGSQFFSKEDERELGGQFFVTVDTTHSSIALMADERVIMTIVAPMPLFCVALRILHMEYGLSRTEISDALQINEVFVFFLLNVYNSPIFDTSDPYYIEIVNNVIESVRAVEFYREQEVVRPRLSVADVLRGLHKMKRTDTGELESTSDEDKKQAALAPVFEGALDRAALAEALLWVMKKRDLSVRKAADAAGTSASVISSIKSGEASLDKAAEVLENLGFEVGFSIHPRSDM